MRVETGVSIIPEIVEIKPSRRVLLQDVGIVLGGAAVAMFLCSWFDLNEVFFHWTRRFENLQFDELPMILLVLAAGFMWFALRRYREAGATMEKQRVADARLNELLAENRRLARSNVDAQESERRSVARELHDETGQYLNAIKIDAVSIRDALDRKPEEIRDAATAIVRNTDHVYSVVGELIRRLRPIGLDDLGLVAALEHCIEQWRQRLPHTEISLAASGDFSLMSEHDNLAVYRVVQESLTNVAKHANAKHVTVGVAATPSGAKTEISLSIVDDGIGANLRSERTGFGLISMRERIDMQGGKMKIETAPGRGFALQAHFSI